MAIEKPATHIVHTSFPSPMTHSNAHQWFKKHQLLKDKSFKTLSSDQALIKQTFLPKHNLPHLNPRHALIWSFVTQHKASKSRALPPLAFPNTGDGAAALSVAEPSPKMRPMDQLDGLPSSSARATDSQNLMALDQIHSLSQLRQALENYDGCALKSFAGKTVFADGNPQSPVMFIGEAPGAEEDAQGLPFVGLSGQLLDRMMNSIGLDRTNAYITNIVPWRPPGNRTPTSIEVPQCLPFIQRHIELVNPKVIILVGATAAKALLQRQDGIMKLRGQWLSYSSPTLNAPIDILATFHPAYLLRSPGQKREAWKDMLMVQEKLHFFKRGQP